MTIPNFLKLDWAGTEQVHNLVRELGVPISTRAPKTLPAAFIKAFRAGGETDSIVIDRAVYVFEFYAKTEEKAEALAFAARDLINAAPYGSNPVRRVTWASGVASLPDPNYPEHERYTFTVILTLRASSNPTPTP